MAHWRANWPFGHCDFEHDCAKCMLKIGMKHSCISENMHSGAPDQSHHVDKANPFISLKSCATKFHYGTIIGLVTQELFFYMLIIPQFFPEVSHSMYILYYSIYTCIQSCQYTSSITF